MAHPIYSFLPHIDKYQSHDRTLDLFVNILSRSFRKHICHVCRHWNRPSIPSDPYKHLQYKTRSRYALETVILSTIVIVINSCSIITLYYLPEIGLALDIAVIILAIAPSVGNMS